MPLGSIAGAGEFNLGLNELVVHSGKVSGLILQGITLPGDPGASLEKIGGGTLTLSHAGNAFSGGILLAGGVLDIAAPGAAGSGKIHFDPFIRSTVKIDNAALSAHVFGIEIDVFHAGHTKHNAKKLRRCRVIDESERLAVARASASNRCGKELCAPDLALFVARPHRQQVPPKMPLSQHPFNAKQTLHILLPNRSAIWLISQLRIGGGALLLHWFGLLSVLPRNSRICTAYGNGHVPGAAST